METGAEGLEAGFACSQSRLGKHWGSRGLGKDCGRESACSHGRSPVFQIALVMSTNFTSSLLDPRNPGIRTTVITPPLTGDTIQEFYISGNHQDQTTRSWARGVFAPPGPALGELLGAGARCSWGAVGSRLALVLLDQHLTTELTREAVNYGLGFRVRGYLEPAKPEAASLQAQAAKPSARPTQLDKLNRHCYSAASAVYSGC